MEGDILDDLGKTFLSGPHQCAVKGSTHGQREHFSGSPLAGQITGSLHGWAVSGISQSDRQN